MEKHHITIYINNIPVSCDESMTVLNAGLQAGIYIPNLCSHPQLKPIGACRLCLVEIEGRAGAVTSCTERVRDGMRIQTETELVRRLRRLSAELILSEHPEDCSSCPVYGNCILQSVFQYVGASNGRFRSAETPCSSNKKNPLFVHDMYRCVKCGRCIRVCRDVRGVGALGYIRNKGDGALNVGYRGELLADTDCRFCGACVEICPAGALRDQPGLIDTSLPREQALVPCRNRCPAHIDVPAYIRCIQRGAYQAAVAVIRQRAPFPASLGYVCSRFCESVCRRKEVNEAVSIRALKCAAAALDNGNWKKAFYKRPSSGKKVAVIGGGPAGMTAALYLVQCGNAVDVFEKQPEAGGMLRYGIPAYRLPDGVIQSEISDMAELGVRVHTGVKADTPAQLLARGYDAVLIAIGAQQGTRLPIPGANLPGTISNIAFLRAARTGRPLTLGNEIAVLGGGNVAFDCARTAVRLGAACVKVICLEGKDQMKADGEEILAAKAEGIKIINARAFLAIEGETGVTGVRTAAVTAFSFDENGGARIECDEKHAIVERADTVVFSVGQKPEDSGAMGVALRGAWICADEDGQTSLPGVFAAGDVVTGTKSVIEAIAGGRRAAERIAAYLGNALPDMPAEPRSGHGEAWIGRMPGFAGLQRQQPRQEAGARESNGSSWAQCPYGREQAREEAARCLQCDLRIDIEPQRFWSDFKKGGARHELD